MKIIVTGCAGFIGYHLTKKYLEKNIKVIGIDNLNDYYSVKLKKDRLKDLYNHPKSKNFFFNKVSLENFNQLKKIFLKHKVSIVVNLAAQAGVRNSIIKPIDYVKSNLVGFSNIIILSKEFNIKHFVYASTSSVYGNSNKTKLSEFNSVDHPIQFYAATKRSNELIAHSYSSLFNIPTTGLRFFTVYGPWGRPDMALFKFTDKIIKRKPIEIYNYGNHSRDFTYIDDVTNAIFLITKKKFILKKKKKFYNNDPSESNCPFRILNVGNNKPVNLKKYIEILENSLEIKAIKKYKSLQKGDVPKTNASLLKIKKLYKYLPKTKIENGVKNFIKWYKEYYKI